MAKTFPISDVLSVVTETLVSSMEGVRNILNYMTGIDLSTSQIPSAMKECKQHILLQNPQLSNVPNVNVSDIPGWLDSQKYVYGDRLAITPINVS
ncbi:hypothetical protein [Paenibacillus sp. NPDC057967]|uniref:DUF7736 domain-containing protein n=1 Tax=Paenibacillus sp. NPDC057967 TaxID=3346293 RepID=UPI0036DD81C1